MNVLLISYPFPPIPYSGTYRMLRLCKGLSKLGVKVHVLTININKNIPNDFDLLSQIPESVTVHRTQIFDPWIKYQHWKKAHRNMTGFRYINKITSLLFRLSSLPDHQIFWIPFAMLKGSMIIREHEINTILVSSPPNSSQLIGYFLKKMQKVKWIADLRDPVVGNIAATHLINPSDFMSKMEKKLLCKLERIIKNNADAIIANTETHKKELKMKFETTKVHTIKNCFDEDDYKKKDVEKFHTFTISHLGSMYGLRKADILFQVIKKLEKKMAPKPLNLQVFFVGLNDRFLHKAIRKYGIEKYIKIRGLVPHKEAIEIMMKSHILLLIKANGEGSYGQIPAKFFEYLGTQNRILYLGPDESEVAQIINKLNCGYVFGDNDDEMLRILREEYVDYLNGDCCSLTDPMIKEFSSSKMASRIASLISKL